MQEANESECLWMNEGSTINKRRRRRKTLKKNEYQKVLLKFSVQMIEMMGLNENYVHRRLRTRIKRKSSI